MNCDKKNMLLYAVTDRAWTNKISLYEQVETALKNGVTCIQLREKELSEEVFLQEALQMKDLCHKYKVPFIVNDNVKIAIKSGADGVHIGQEDLSASDVRVQIGEKMIMGVSVHNVTEAVVATKKGADYLGIGAIFATDTKHDAEYVPIKTVQEICKVVSIPTVAIGGINATNIAKLNDSGVDGVAIVSAIFAADDIAKATREMLKAVQDMIGDRNIKRSEQ